MRTSRFTRALTGNPLGLALEDAYETLLKETNGCVAFSPAEIVDFLIEQRSDREIDRVEALRLAREIKLRE